MVLVNHIVAMHRVTPKPVAESHLDCRAAPRNQTHRVLARQIDAGLRAVIATRPAILAAPSGVIAGVVAAAAIEARRSLDDLVFLHMHVDGMRPVPTVLKLPLLKTV